MEVSGSKWMKWFCTRHWMDEEQIKVIEIYIMNVKLCVGQIFFSFCP